MSTTFGRSGAPGALRVVTHTDRARDADGVHLNGWLLHWLQRLSGIEATLGNQTEAGAWMAEAKKLRGIMQARYYEASTATYCRGQGALSIQGANTLALQTGLPTPEDNVRVLAAILGDIPRWSNHQSTGSRLSYPLLSALTRFGAVDEAYRLMARTGYPSLGHMLSFGFGTIFSTWALDVNAPSEACVCQLEGLNQMATWLVRELCGINPVLERPGFKEVVLEPWLPSRLEAAGVTVPTPYGELVSRWRQSAVEASWEIRVPPNTNAIVRVPCSDPQSVRESGKPVGTSAMVQAIGVRDGRATYRTPSGRLFLPGPRKRRLAGWSGNEKAC